MKRTNIYLDEDQARVLRHLSVEEGRSFTDIVREALNEYLARRGVRTVSRVVGPRRTIPEEQWRSRFEAALERIRSAVPTHADPEDLESEVSAARDEVRKERSEQRRASRGS